MKIVEQNGDRDIANPPFRRGKRISTPTDMSNKEIRIAGILAEKGMPGTQAALPLEKPAAEVGAENRSLLKDKNAISSDENFNV